MLSKLCCNSGFLKQTSFSIIFGQRIANCGQFRFKSSAKTIVLKPSLKTWIKGFRPKFSLFKRSPGAELTETQRKIIGWWLLGCSGMVFGAVTLGGLTRLTESGLSIVDWRLIKGMKPPTNETEWLLEFEKYKFYPEYHMKNSMAAEAMDLDEFKFIFYMEYFHRMWGRMIGMAFLLPATFFWYKGWFKKPMKKRIVAAGGLLVFQGLLGWYMVKSGLDPSNNSEADIARVSHYRLAGHLTAAFVLYSMLLWCSLSHLLKPIDYSKVPKFGSFRGLAHFSKSSMFLTAIFGALVAGLDAGLVHNTWPKYSGQWLPSDLWLEDFKRANFTENPAMVQFIHRNLGYLSLLAVTATWFMGRRLPLDVRTRRVLAAVMATGYIQVSLGIAALVSHVPVAIAAAHQNCFMIMLTFVIWLTHELRRNPMKL